MTPCVHQDGRKPVWGSLAQGLWIIFSAGYQTTKCTLRLGFVELPPVSVILHAPYLTLSDDHLAQLLYH